MSLKLKGSASNHEPTCYKLGTSLLGINFELADKTQFLTIRSYPILR